MASRAVNIRVPETLYKRLQSHISQTGSTQTDAILAAMASYFGADNMVPLVERMSQLEQRLSALEQG
ncbi:MAG: hypothetical protein VKJ02_18445 [Snowella sp.]|nr:hypothetical protein [Snowella sp.]